MINKEDTKILVLVIDWTLLNSKKEITPATKEALIKVQEAGHILALASGRPFSGIRKFAKELRMDEFGGYALSFNGGVIIDCKTERVLYSKSMDKEYAHRLFDFAVEQDIGMVTYKNNKIYTGTKVDEYIEYEARLNFAELVTTDDFKNVIDCDVPKCLFTALPQKAAECEKLLADMYGDILNVTRSEPFFIEVTVKGVDKADSLDGFIKQIGIKHENTICCGDGFNDLTMVKYAAVGVAMENAQDSVKEVADFVTKSCDEDGIVKVVEKYIL